MKRPTAPRPGPSRTRRLRHRDSMRFLAHPRRFRESLRLDRQRWWRNSALVGLQAGLVVAIALPVAHLSPWPHLIGFASLGALVALFGRFAERGRRGWVLLIAGLLQCAGVLVMSLSGLVGMPLLLQSPLLAALAGLFHVLSLKLRLGPPGAVIFVFAAAAATAAPADVMSIVERTGATGAVSLLALIICLLTERFREVDLRENGYPGDHLPKGYDLRAATLRIVLAAMAAGYLALAVGAHHPAWAAMGAIVVLQGAQLHVTASRSLQRVAGTIFGAGIAWIILSIDPDIWVYVLILIALQIATELVIGSNYALGQVFVTPMALLMTHLALPSGQGTDLAPERVLDTIIGAGVGLLVGLAFSTLQDRKALARHHAKQTRIPRG